MKLLLRQFIPIRRDSVHDSHRYSIWCCIALLLAALFCSTEKLEAGYSLPPKIITVKVNSSGIISIGRDTISSDDLAMYIRERLFKSYTGTGKMYDAIRLVKEGEPEPVVLDVVLKEITSGQKKALNELCLEKHKKVFEDISDRQKAKLKKNYKVLFQTSYD